MYINQGGRYCMPWGTPILPIGVHFQAETHFSDISKYFIAMTR